MVSWALMLGCAFLDRWGGGGFAFLSAQLPTDFLTGCKPARRYGLPLLVFTVHPSLAQAVLCVAMAAILSFNLKEIEARNWEELFLHGFGLAAVLWPIAGLWALLVPAWWLAGVYASNVGVKTWKLGWHWVELGRGAMIGLALAFGRG